MRIVNSQIVSTPGLLYYKPWYMERQISQYSLCVSVTQFTFYMVSSTFYKVNFFFIRSTFYFLYGQFFTFYIGQCQGQTADFRLQTVDRELSVDCR